MTIATAGGKAAQQRGRISEQRDSEGSGNDSGGENRPELRAGRKDSQQKHKHDFILHGKEKKPIGRAAEEGYYPGSGTGLCDDAGNKEECERFPTDDGTVPN